MRLIQPLKRCSSICGTDSPPSLLFNEQLDPQNLTPKDQQTIRIKTFVTIPARYVCSPSLGTWYTMKFMFVDFSLFCRYSKTAAFIPKLFCGRDAKKEADSVLRAWLTSQNSIHYIETNDKLFSLLPPVRGFPKQYLINRRNHSFGYNLVLKTQLPPWHRQNISNMIPINLL